jgi:hypothetical protein
MSSTRISPRFRFNYQGHAYPRVHHRATVQFARVRLSTVAALRMASGSPEVNQSGLTAACVRGSAWRKV